MAYDFHLGEDQREASRNPPVLQVDYYVAQDFVECAKGLFKSNEHIARLGKIGDYYGREAELRYLPDEFDALLVGLARLKPQVENRNVLSFIGTLEDVIKEAKTENKTLFGFAD
ncbi:MAG: hypothetical protein KC900_10215 [Candidatus Omnitrophica bacterium]|nr:hypothetical protein [Candidatus Omnitrophota bacterium]